MYTLGHDFVPPSIHAGGLRYHGNSPIIISSLVRLGRMEALAYPQSKMCEAGLQLARTQGTVPPAETTHAIRAVIGEVLTAKEQDEERVILFTYSGHGLAGPLRIRRRAARPLGGLSEHLVTESRRRS